jgi:hypothetical protein
VIHASTTPSARFGGNSGIGELLSGWLETLIPPAFLGGADDGHSLFQQ